VPARAGGRQVEDLINGLAERNKLVVILAEVLDADVAADGEGVLVLLEQTEQWVRGVYA
jgi:hypothetical protein